MPAWLECLLKIIGIVMILHGAKGMFRMRHARLDADIAAAFARCRMPPCDPPPAAGR
jgi:hypothetical protein